MEMAVKIWFQSKMEFRSGDSCFERTAFWRIVRASLGLCRLCENRYANDIPPESRRSSYR